MYSYIVLLKERISKCILYLLQDIKQSLLQNLNIGSSIYAFFKNGH